MPGIPGEDDEQPASRSATWMSCQHELESGQRRVDLQRRTIVMAINIISTW